jgi:methanogenic corrinoid protein MtbC1
MAAELAKTGPRSGPWARQLPKGRHLSAPPVLAEHFADGFVAALQADDPAGMHRALDAAEDVLGLASCLDDVLLPAMREIGVLWHDNQCSVAQERLATECARAWLQTHEVRVPAPHPGNPIVLACGPADRHSLGLEALGVLLRYDRQACRLLGAKVSDRTLATAIRASMPAGVVLVSHLRVNRDRTVESLRTIHDLGPQLFFAGGAFATVRLRRNVPGTYLGTRLQSASALIIRAVTVDDQSPGSVTS